MKIGIIGGGPAGIFAALEASKQTNHVVLFDNNPHVGRKLAATGAGRGNLTNQNVSSTRYTSLENFQYSEIIESFNYSYLVDYFNNIGIFTYHTDDGWVYPLSNSAKNLSLYLESLLIRNKVEIIHSVNVISIHYENNLFLLKLDNGKSYSFEKIILASGGKAHPQLNASSTILNCIEMLGHHVLPSFPALAPVKTTKFMSKMLTGIRMDLDVQMLLGDAIVASSFGNIIFTEWGLNGPGIMNISHLIHQYPSNLEICLRFMNTSNAKIIAKLMAISKKQQINPETLLLNIFPQKLVDQLIQNTAARKLNFENLTNYDMAKLEKSLSLREKILGTRDFTFAQLSTGAIANRDVNATTLESRLIPGLFFAGELLDVMGPCGGYNLHWAFVSGIVAGRSVLNTDK